MNIEYSRPTFLYDKYELFRHQDAALQLLGNLFPVCLRERNKDRAIVLGATSGDTGSAAVAGVQGQEKVF